MRRRSLILAAAVVVVAALGVYSVTGLSPSQSGDPQPAETALSGAADAAPKSNSDVILIGEETPRLLFLTTTDSLVRAGYFYPGRPFVIGQTSLATGRYVVGYSFEVRHSGWPSSAATLECALVEAESGIRIEPQEPTSVSASDGWTSLEFGMRVDLPSMTVAIHCAPTTPGLTQSEFAGVSLFALRVS